MMVKYPQSGHIQILESLREPGVQKWNWDSFITKKWNSNYSKITLRKLNLMSGTKNVADREELNRLLFKLVRTVIGANFRFGYDKLINQQSVPEESDPEVPIDTE